MLDCFYCGGALFKVTDASDCCSSCGKIDVYRQHYTYELPIKIVKDHEEEQDNGKQGKPSN